MHIVIIGATGQLGTDLQKALQGSFAVITPLSRKDLDIRNSKQTQAVLTQLQPDVVIDCAAYTHTEGCEAFPEDAFAVNAIAVKTLAEVCRKIDSTLVYISTDYVFDGQKGQPYCEDDPPRPLNTYGISKLAGEFFAQSVEKHYIIRVASLYGVAGSRGKGGNFVETMIQRARTESSLQVVSDIYMSPTYTQDAAMKIYELLQAGVPYGVYHVTNRGWCSWYEFAQAIFEILGLQPKLVPVRAADYPTKVRRPMFSALESRKLVQVGIEPLREWKEALRAYLKEKGHIP